MASLTTAIGMASLLVSTLVPVREFGLYSALGVLLSLLMILYGFPSLLAVLGGLPKRFEQIDVSRWRRYGKHLARHHLAWTIGFGGAFALGLFGLRYFHTETKVIRYFPPSTRIVQDYNAIEESLAGVITIDTVIYFDHEARERMDILERIELVRAVEESIREAEGVSGTLSVADFREPTSPPSNPIARRIYKNQVSRAERALFSDESRGDGRYESSRQLVCKVETPLTFTRNGRTVRFDSGIDENDPNADTVDANEIWQVRAQSAMMTDLDYGDLVEDLNRRAAAAIAAATHGPEGDSDDSGVNYVVTGMVPLFLRTQQAVIESLILSFGLAFVAIAVTMIVLLRSVTSGLLSMIPNVWPTVMVFGMISLGNVPVDIGTMITASVAMGIAVDGTVHLLTWFRNGILAGYDRHEAMSRALAHCGPALWQTSATIALAMLMVIFTDLLLVSRFGWIMSATVTAALLADIALTPALLAGPLGGLIERALKRQRERTHSEPDAAVSAPARLDG
jgi:predicted RND superfamily exporter protein